MELTEILHFKQLVNNISVILNNRTHEQGKLNAGNFQRQIIQCGKSILGFQKMLRGNSLSTQIFIQSAK